MRHAFLAGAKADGTEPSLTELRLRNTEAKLARLIEAVHAAIIYLTNEPHDDDHLATGLGMLMNALEDAKP